MSELRGLATVDVLRTRSPTADRTDTLGLAVSVTLTQRGYSIQNLFLASRDAVSRRKVTAQHRSLFVQRNNTLIRQIFTGVMTK